MRYYVSELMRRIARDPIATADLWGPVLAPMVALLLLLVTHQFRERWPDLWRFRRAVLPVVDRLADGRYDQQVNVVDAHAAIDVSTAVDALPEKTGLPLQAREFAGTLDAPPADVREAFRAMDRVYPNTLASIQYDVVDGERVWEVGSYAYRSEGFLDEWQVHVRLTPADGGRKTRLWAHYERSAWRHPVKHYNGEGWDADEGVQWVASVFANDERYVPSDAAIDVVNL